MEKFLFAIKKYSVEYLIYISFRAPIWLIGAFFAYKMLSSPVFTKEQYGWLAAYTFVAGMYFNYVEVVENIINRASKNENN